MAKQGEHGISWTDETWNPIAGCSRVSEGCRHCYAERLAARGLPGFEGLAHFVDRPTGAREARWTGAVTVREHLMDQPLRWKRPRRIFVNSMSDLFHDAVPDEVIDRIFAVMALAPQHSFQILTKRPERMKKYLTGANGRIADAIMKIRESDDGKSFGVAPNGRGPVPHLDAGKRWFPLPNVWLGVSVEDQVTADVRIPYLLDTPAAIRFASYEPALGPIHFGYLGWPNEQHSRRTGCSALTGIHYVDGEFCRSTPRLDLVIMGGESGPNARPMHPDWARQTRDQCTAAGVPFFFKQWGEWAPSTPEEARGNPHSGWQYLAGHPHIPKAEELYPEAGAAFVERKGKRTAGRLLDGVEHNDIPEPHHA